MKVFWAEGAGVNQSDQGVSHMVEEHAVVLRESFSDGKSDVPRTRSASRFGAWRARHHVRLAGWHLKQATAPLVDSNPAKNTIVSAVDAYAERTRDLPGRGILPVDPNAPLIRLKEALWVLVAPLVVMWAISVGTGDHPVIELIRLLF